MYFEMSCKQRMFKETNDSLIRITVHWNFEGLRGGIQGEFGKTIQMLTITMQNLKPIAPTIYEEFGYRK